MGAQCKTCPWRKGARTRDIPGYSAAQHRALARTIARPGDVAPPQSVMACHCTPEGRESVCVGWLHHQLTRGNNIGLRLRVLHEPELGAYTLRGPQRATFEETFYDGDATGDDAP